MESPSLLLTILAFLLLLGPLVVVHELGHYLVGRWFGVRAEAFSVGFGKELAGWTDRRGTRWKLSALPLGGYVQFAGDMNPASQAAQIPSDMPAAERAGLFQTKPLWQRALIVLAGPVTNLLLAIAIFAGFNMIYGKAVVTPEVAQIVAGSPAAKAGVRTGDRILAIDGDRVDDFAEIREKVAPFPGETLRLTVRRAGETLTVPVRISDEVVKDEFGNAARIGRIGIGAGKIAFEQLGPVQSVTVATDQTVSVIKMMVTGIKQIVVGDRSVKELGGPLKIAQYSGQQLSLGWLQFVSFAALISINLAFINLLPIPALDGGHLAFYAAEAVRRKPVGARGQEWAFRTGLAFVLALMLFVTVNDIASLGVFGR